MEKIIKVGDREIKVVCNAFMPILYKRQFGRDFFADMMKMDGASEGDFSHIDIETMFNMVWCMARLADKSIPPSDEWLECFDVFPISEIIPEVTNMLISTFNPSKNAEAVQSASL